MRLAMWVSVAAILCCGASLKPVARPDHDSRSEDAHGEGRISRMPILESDARAWLILHETMIKPAPSGTPFKDVMALIRKAIRENSRKNAPVDFYVDPITLQENEIKPDTPIELSLFGLDEISLHEYVKLITRSLILRHRVRNGVIVIKNPPDDRPGYQFATAPEARTWLRLHEVVPMNYPEGTPLRTVLEDITHIKVAPDNHPHKLAFVVDRRALERQDRTLDWPITIELEHTPLCTSLSLILNQLGLTFYVRDDGIILITDDVNTEMDISQVIDGLRVEQWAESLRQEREQAAEEKKGGGFGKGPK